MFMMFADNVEENFGYCIQNIQGNYMNYLLEPVNYVTGVLTEVGGEFSSNIMGVRNMISNLRDAFSTITSGIFGVFLNIVIEFQKMTISIKDLVGKIIGVVTIMMHVLSGAQMTMESAWNGPPGQMVKSLGSSCFHPSTKLRLQSGKLVSIKDIDVGDVLYDNSIVQSTLKMKNRLKESLYCFQQKGENREDILVSGNHFVFYHGEWMRVKNVVCGGATVKKSEIYSDILYNLMTSSGHIKIGEITFYDYEDDELTSTESQPHLRKYSFVR